jgi:hypothetical protein
MMTGMGDTFRGARISVVSVFLLLAFALHAQQPSTSGGGYDPATDPSGMYSFLKDGEFLQITLEDGELSGFVSRFGDSESDRGQFIDQFFDKGTLKNDHLTFTTKTVHGVWYSFDGSIAKQPGKQPGQEGYRVIKGTLKQHLSDANKVDRIAERTVEFKSFPETVSRP